MMFFRFLTIVFVFLGSLDLALGQEISAPVKNDSIILAQAYLNLTLTKVYFEGLSEERISKILSFEEKELTSIRDWEFIKANAALYHFSFSLLNYNRAKYLFRTKSAISRSGLIEWKKSLDQAIRYFNLSKSNETWFGDPSFFELIKFEPESYSKLHQDLYELKDLFTWYFTADLYPDFQRIFLKAKNQDRYEIDSLSYLAGIYDLDASASILKKTFEPFNYNYGPNTIALPSPYSHLEKSEVYNPNENPIKTAYRLDDKLALISSYVQLKFLTAKSNQTNLTWFERYRLYNDYYIFKDKSLDQAFITKITQEKDLFLKKELNEQELDQLLLDLKEKYAYDSYATAQAFINLSLIQANFETLSKSRIATLLETEERELAAVKNEDFLTQNAALYHFTYALLYENSARLLFQSHSDHIRKTLVEWKEVLGKSIQSFNLSQQKSRGGQTSSESFYQLIQFDKSDVTETESKILKMKSLFTPYFNKDIYADFQRIYYRAKNSAKYDFDSLKAISGIYSIPIEFEILNPAERGRRNTATAQVNDSYNLENRLDLISRYLQLKFIASSQYTPSGRGVDVPQLYNHYRAFLQDLKPEKDEFIQSEFTNEAIDTLFEELQRKYPYRFENLRPTVGAIGREIIDRDSDGIKDSQTSMSMFFPTYAPLASASYIKQNFRPELTTLGKVNNFLRQELISAGYSNQLHYYYASDGFALTTSLERFNLDGSAVPSAKRFVNSLTEDKQLSYYEVFKSLFFDLEYEYRMFAMVVSSNAALMSKDGMTPGFAEKLIANSYTNLPADLTNKSLPKNTLSIFVYHFHLNLDNGTVELDLSGKIKAQEYLKKAGLSKLIQ